MSESINVRETWGAVVVERKRETMTERWWFHETEAGRLVLCGHVRDYDNDVHDFPVAGRHYTARSELSASTEVRDALRDAGYDGTLYVQTGPRTSSVRELPIEGE